MAYRKNASTKRWEAVIKDRIIGVVHLALRTKNEREAGRRHAAVEALIRQASTPDGAEVLRLLRAQKQHVEAVTATYEAGRPFGSLLARDTWPTLADAAAAYLAWVEQHPDRAPGTWAVANARLGVLLELLGGDRRVDTITGDDIATLRTALAARPLRKGTTDTLSATTVGYYLAALAALYRWLQGREDKRALHAKRPANVLYLPIDADLIPGQRARRARFLSSEEAGRVLAATPDRLRAAVALGILAGLRIGEVQYLQPQDVDLDLDLVYVQPKPAPWLPGREWHPKSSASVREVALEPQLAAVLRAHVARYASDAWVFPGMDRADRPMSRTALSSATARLVRDAGLVARARDPQGVSFHTFRHTFASWLVMAGADLFTVSRLLGHATTTLVEQTYSHLSPEHRGRTVRLLTRWVALSPSTPDPADDAADAPMAPAGVLTTDHEGVSL